MIIIIWNTNSIGWVLVSAEFSAAFLPKMNVQWNLDFELKMKSNIQSLSGYFNRMIKYNNKNDATNDIYNKIFHSKTHFWYLSVTKPHIFSVIFLKAKKRHPQKLYAFNTLLTLRFYQIIFLHLAAIINNVMHMKDISKL